MIALTRRTALLGLTTAVSLGRASLAVAAAPKQAGARVTKASVSRTPRRMMSAIAPRIRHIAMDDLMSTLDLTTIRAKSNRSRAMRT